MGAGVVGKRNPVTLRMEWRLDADRRVPVRFFAAVPYRMLGVVPLACTSSGRRRRQHQVHLLGTDRLGRDQWSRLMHGTRTSMTIGLAAVILSVSSASCSAASRGTSAGAPTWSSSG